MSIVNSAKFVSIMACDLYQLELIIHKAYYYSNIEFLKFQCKVILYRFLTVHLVELFVHKTQCNPAKHHRIQQISLLKGYHLLAVHQMELFIHKAQGNSPLNVQAVEAVYRQSPIKTLKTT